MNVSSKKQEKTFKLRGSLRKWSITIAILAVLIAGVVTSAIGNITDLPYPTVLRDGDDNCPKPGLGCHERDAIGYLEPPDSTSTPSCEDYIDYLRVHDAYLGENTDYIFLKASVHSYDPYVLTVDPEGTHYFGIPIDDLEDWIDQECP